MTRLNAPWTPAQVAALNRWQSNGRVHPFTCGSGDRMDDAHVSYAVHKHQDPGTLVASVSGWFCPVCSYRQTWAHDFMTMNPDAPPSVGSPP